jgi:DNA end-binding protein Ku
MATTIWKGQISFGLVSIPVRLQRAARKERIALHYVSKVPRPAIDEEPGLSSVPLATETGHDLPESEVVLPVAPGPVEESNSAGSDFSPQMPEHISRIKQVITTIEEDRPIRRNDLMRGYEVAPDRYVTIRDDELRGLRAATSATMEIVRSVRLVEIDPVFFETSYYVVPDPSGERAYALLVSALRDTGYVALATFAMHGREHVVVVRPGKKGLIAHAMYYVDEVRAENEYPANMDKSNPKEMELAKAFVEAIAGPFAPEDFRDNFRERVQTLISAKESRNEVAVSVPQPTVPPSRQAPVTDIMDALKKSLELRKPAASERKSAQSEKGTELKRGPRKRRA